MSIMQEIQAADKQFVAAFNRGDSAAVAGFYTKDAQIFPANFDVMKGEKAIQAFWQKGLDMGLTGLTLEPAEVESVGDAAIENGRYTLSGKDGQVVDEGKYLVYWRKVDGAWKLYWDIWNTSRPQE